MASSVIVGPIESAFVVDVRAGLTKLRQKELPPKYFYDALGSKLFDAICELLEYGVTRADERILKRVSPQITEFVARRCDGMRVGQRQRTQTQTGDRRRE